MTILAVTLKQSRLTSEGSINEGYIDQLVLGELILNVCLFKIRVPHYGGSIPEVDLNCILTES